MDLIIQYKYTKYTSSVNNKIRTQHSFKTMSVEAYFKISKQNRSLFLSPGNLKATQEILT